VIVIEASAMVDALVDDPANPELLALMADADMHAPALLDYEVASALRGHVLAGLLSDERLAHAVDAFGSLRIDRHPLSSMMRGVLALRENFTVYDAAYIVLAQALEAPLVTADGKLSEACKLGIDVQVFRLRP
jgi:predicted nucleic acid-binding protein